MPFLTHYNSLYNISKYIFRAALVPHPCLAFSKKMVQLRPSQCQTILLCGHPTLHVQNTGENAVVATMILLTHYHSLCMTKSIPELHSTTIHGTGMRVSFILITPQELDSHLQTIKKATLTTLTKVLRIYLRLCNNSTNFSLNTKKGLFRLRIRFTNSRTVSLFLLLTYIITTLFSIISISRFRLQIEILFNFV